MSSIQITRYQTSKFAEERYPVVVVIGKRGSGKSILTKDLIFRFSQAGHGRIVVFSPTEPSNRFYEKFIPPVFIHNDLDEAKLAQIVDGQTRLVQKMKQEKSSKNVDLLLVLDDCAFEHKFLNSKTIKKLVLNGRHSRIAVIITLQYAVLLGAALRANIDIAFLLSENVPKVRERLFDAFGGAIRRQREFDSIFQQLTRGYDAFVFTNGRGSEIAETIFFYSAEPNLNFRFGPASLWSYSRARKKI